jgi:hypothetical protein
MWRPSLLSHYRKFIANTLHLPLYSSFGISALPVQVFGIFPLHLNIGSPVPLISPDKVLAVYMPDTPQPLIRLHAVICLVRLAISRFWYHDVILDTSSTVHFRSTPLSIPDMVVYNKIYPSRFLAAQYNSLERTAPQGGLITPPEKRYREDNLNYLIQSLILSIVCYFLIKELFLILYPKVTQDTRQRITRCKIKVGWLAL